MQIRSENNKAYLNVIIYLSPLVVLISTSRADIYCTSPSSKFGLHSKTISDVFINYEIFNSMLVQEVLSSYRYVGLNIVIVPLRSHLKICTSNCLQECTCLWFYAVLWRWIDLAGGWLHPASSLSDNCPTSKVFKITTHRVEFVRVFDLFHADPSLHGVLHCSTLYKDLNMIYN